MDDALTRRILELQLRVTNCLAQFGYADQESALRCGRHLAEISIYGERFANVTLPLFLTLHDENRTAAMELVLAIKTNLDELRDALLDVEADLQNVVDFFLPNR